MNQQQRYRTNKVGLTEDDIQFIMANTDFDREKIVEWHRDFIAKCPGGQLDKPQFIQFFKKLIPGNSADEDKYCEAVFYACDTDSNGFIDFSEFLIAFWIRAKGNMRATLSCIYDIYDTLRSNNLPLWELSSMLKLVVGMKGLNEDVYDLSRKIISSVDRNGDNRISKQEFIAACTKDQKLRNLFAPY